MLFCLWPISLLEMQEFMYANLLQGVVLLQPLQWCCVDCVIHHEQDVREEQKYICVV